MPSSDKSGSEVPCIRISAFQVDFRPSLREIHLGPWEGVLLKDATEKYPHETSQFRHQPEDFSLEGAETFHELQLRARNAISEILDECAGVTENVLVVSHGAFIKSLLIDLSLIHI